MLALTHLQSATQIIELSGIKILTDPWLTDGEYMGTWFHHPQFPENKIADLEYDYIYVSHIHPDHLSEKTFSQLPHKVEVLIPKFDAPFLKRKVESFGWNVIELQHGKAFPLGNGVEITIYLADNCDPELCGRFFGCKIGDHSVMSPNIDSIALFSDKCCRILNTNDSPFALAEETIIKNGLNENIDLLLVGYAGAGPFPQCFQLTEEEMKTQIELKKKQFLDYAVKYVDLVQPSFYVPFAGTYLLGANKIDLNKKRGVPTIKDAIKYIDQNKSTTLSEGIEIQQLDQLTLPNLKIVKNPKIIDLSSTLEKISNYQTQIPKDFPSSDLDELCGKSYKRFKKVANDISLQSETIIILASENNEIVFSKSMFPKLNCNWAPKDDDRILKIELENDLLLALLNGPRWAHWNNAEIGSHLKFTRKNVNFERELGHALYFFHA